VVAISCEFDFPGAQVERKHGNAITVLVRNNEVLTAGVKLEVTRGLSASVEESNLAKFAPLTSLLVHTIDREGLVPPVGDNNEVARGMHTYSTACVHRFGEGLR